METKTTTKPVVEDVVSSEAIPNGNAAKLNKVDSTATLLTDASSSSFSEEDGDLQGHDPNKVMDLHPLAMIVPVDTSETFDDFERKTLEEWGYETIEDAYGPEPYVWRDNLRRTWTEATQETIEGQTTPLRLAMLKHVIKPSRPGIDDPRDGILGRQIAKAAFIKDHPDVLDIDIEPIILIGQNRTGTTLLHRLLSLDDGVRSPKGWELINPLPPPEEATYDTTDPRLIKGVEMTKGFSDLYPTLKYYHEMDINLPEECLLHMTDDIEFGHCINNPGQPIERILDVTEMEAAYVSYKKTLQILSYKYPAKHHWVLKCPSHLPHLKTLVKLFPNAKFVWTHRTMNTVIASFCRLSSVFAVANIPNLTPAMIGQHILKYYTELVEKGMIARTEIERSDDDNDGYGKNRFVDIQFADIVKDPIEQIKHIYQQFGLEYTESFDTKIRDYLAKDVIKREQLSKEQKEANITKPTLEEYGLDPELVEKLFETYHQAYIAN